MVITVTPNPAVDQTVFLDRLEPGGVNRVRTPQLDPAGKGVNASRMVHRLGWPTIAFGFLAGEIGALVEKSLDEEGVPRHFVRVAGQTRINVTAVEEGGRATSLYGPGPAVAPGEVETLRGLIRFWLPAGRVLVLAGSLPPGVPAELYAELIREARDHGLGTILDASGEALRAAIEAGPDLIKPNRAEAEELLGRALPDVDTAIEGARELRERGAEAVALTLGRDGAVCVERNGAWRVVPPRVERRSTVGSGDSFVAGCAVAMARGEPLTVGLRIGTAAGAATAATPGTALGSAETVARLAPSVRIETIAG